jgi:WD40 repeat protein
LSGFSDLMATLFISHDSRDDADVARLAAWLRGEGFESLFVDHDQRAGARWESEIYSQMQRADALLLVCSRHAVESAWCFAEVALARAFGKTVIPVAIAPSAAHPLLHDTQSVDLTAGDSRAFERLRAGLVEAEIHANRSFEWDSRRSPFPGLAAFDEQDAGVFFGRDDEIEELLRRLRSSHRRHTQRLLTVAGPSGCGKSSLIRAGVLPRLRRGREPWLVLPPARPGRRPLHEIALTFAAALGEVGDRRATRTIEAALEQSPEALVDIAEELAHRNPHGARDVLLVLDQAEELVTVSGAAERDAALAVLHGATQLAGPLWVILVLRSEFLGAVLQAGRAGGIVTDDLLVGRLDRGRLAEVIARPAERGGVKISQDLIARMVQDTGGGDGLPLLAYALAVLYEGAGAGRTISTRDYQRLGGVFGALRERADHEHRRLGRNVLPALLKLVTLSPQGEPTRRRVRRSVLSDAEKAVVDAFIDARLVTSDQTDDEPSVEVAHEALLRTWPPLAEAIARERDALATRTELERLADDWERSGRRASYLLGGERLQSARRWQQDHSSERSQMVSVWEFLEQSARESADGRRRAADAIADRVLAGFAEDPEIGVILAVAAYDQYGESSLMPVALRHALAPFSARPPRVLRGPPAPLRDAAWSPDGRRLATASEEHAIRVWDVVADPSEPLVLGVGEPPARALAWSLGRGLLAAARGDRTVQLWDVQEGKPVLTVGLDSQPTALAWAPDGRGLACCSTGGAASPPIATDTAGVTVLDVGEGRALEWSPDGTRLLTAHADGAVVIRDLADGTVLLELDRQPGGVWGAAWSPNGRRLVTAGSDGGVNIWDARSGVRVLRLRGHDYAALAVAWSADGDRIVSGSVDGRTRVWEAATGAQAYELRGHEGAVRAVAWAADGVRLATASEDGTARVWSVAEHEPAMTLRGHDDAVRGVAWARAGGRLATASYDGTARLWASGDGATERIISRVGAPAPRNRGERWEGLLGRHGSGYLPATVPEPENLKPNAVFGVVWSPDGEQLATAAADGAHVWRRDPVKRLLTLRESEDSYAAERDGVLALTWSRTGAHVATAAFDGAVALWDPSCGRLLARFAKRRARFRDVAFAPNGKRLATVSARGVTVWKTASQKRVITLRALGTAVRAVDWAPDGKCIVGALADGTAQVWDVSSGQVTCELRPPHESEVLAVAWSPDGSRIASASADRTARIWDAGTGRVIRELRGHAGAVLGLAWSPDSEQLATASADRSVRIWDEPTFGRLVAFARTVCSRGLSEEERARFRLSAP